MTVLLLAAAALWLWPGTEGRQRLGRLTGGRRRRSGPVGSWVVPVAALAGVAAIGAIGGLALGVAAGMVGGLLTHQWRRRRAGATAERRDTELSRALSAMIAELSVGAPPTAACAVAADELRSADPAAPLADGLTWLAGRAELGGAAAVAALAGGPGTGTVGDPAWTRIARAWSTAARHGLPMAELLASLRADVGARRDFAESTRAGLAGPRATAVVLAGLPILGVALGQAMGAGPLAVLLGGGAGSMLLVIGTGLAVAGVLWSERITDKVVSR